MLGPGRELGVLRDHAEFLLVGDNLVTQRVPALVEQVQVGSFLDPFGCRMMRCVRGAGSVVEEERDRGIDGVQSIQPVDGFIGHGGDQVPSGTPDKWRNQCGVAEQQRGPLAAIATDEPVEIFKSHAGRPLVEWAGLTRLISWSVVILSEPRGAVSVLEKNAADGGGISGKDAVVAGESGGLL